MGGIADRGLVAALSRLRVQTVQAATACEEGCYVAYSSIAAAFGNSANPMRILADRI